MAVQGPWVGSSAVSETGVRWGWEQRIAVRLPGAGWYSELIGRSKEVILELTENTSYNKDWLIDWLRAQGGTPAVINVRGNMVSYSENVPTFEFPADLPNAYVTLNNYSAIWGRGGRGAGGGYRFANNATAGGTAINNQIGGRLRINNAGRIAGGGGGGGTYNEAALIGAVLYGAGGGFPMGAGGAGALAAGAAGSLSGPGAGGTIEYPYAGGSGGWAAQAGVMGVGSVSATPLWPAGGGAAVVGNAPVWRSVGTIYGDRV